MPFKVSYHKSFERDLKDFKQNKKQKEEILKTLQHIVENPLDGKSLLGQWKNFYNFSFANKPELRILYVVYPCCPIDIKDRQQCRFDDVETNNVQTLECLGLIDFVFVKTREACNNLYAKDKRYIKGFFLE